MKLAIMILGFVVVSAILLYLTLLWDSLIRRKRRQLFEDTYSSTNFEILPATARVSDYPEISAAIPYAEKHVYLSPGAINRKNPDQVEIILWYDQRSRYGEIAQCPIVIISNPSIRHYSLTLRVTASAELNRIGRIFRSQTNQAADKLIRVFEIDGEQDEIQRFRSDLEACEAVIPYENILKIQLNDGYIAVIGRYVTNPLIYQKLLDSAYLLEDALITSN